MSTFSAVVLIVGLPFCLQASPVDSSHQALDEGLFHVLYGASLSLSSIITLLDSPAGVTHEEEAQLRLLQLQV